MTGDGLLERNLGLVAIVWLRPRARRFPKTEKEVGFGRGEPPCRSPSGLLSARFARLG